LRTPTLPVSMVPNVAHTKSSSGSQTTHFIEFSMVFLPVLGFGLFSIFTQIADQTLRATRLAGDADVASMQNQPVMHVLQVLGRRELDEPVLHLARVLARRDAGAVRDAKNMRIDRHGRLAEGRVQH